ncbi:Chromatin assembly factor 1 subunit A,Armadillo-like helical [Cinara cedri]|uniref:Chromatin assembly factor 1 subunit A,Armadillo-like helical n=1 Tax=Cinara cedri TaxID=506608 RepID=A0A5E4N7Y6_9HEMI|nr:Chromatin assembly factor 1 subunit A,Armadillo-like helical [Cinara cedri]
MSANKAAKPAKKLVQRCLPFKLINSPGDDGTSMCRKRKLSGTEIDDLQVENPKIELLNGGTKCFIKSEDENKNHSKEIIVIDNGVVNENSLKESATSATILENCINESNEDKSSKESATSVTSLETCTDESNKDNSFKESIILETTLDNCIDDLNKGISNVDTTKIDENVMDIDDSDSMTIDSDLLNNSVNSTSDNGKTENTTPTSKDSKHKRKRPESAKKQEERLRLKQEKEKAREEKLEKQRLKQIEKEQKRNAEIEAKRLREVEKEREKKQKEDERKAKELEKEREKNQKEEERKAKELEKEKDRKQKEEERKAKELEKEKQTKEKLLRDELEKKRNEKVKAAFVGFFKPKSLILDNSVIKEEIIDQNQKSYFMPFQTKQDMKLAPSCRVYLNSDKKKYIDTCVNQCEENKDLLYLNLLKTGKYKPLKSEATWPVYVEDDTDVIIIETGSANSEDENVNKISTRSKNCWKLLQFKENKRPPYWGTWRKKSLYVKPRRPFACDKIMFDYEIDSDDEWEEEDPGESIHGTDDEEEPEDDYEVDNDIFVPHGYLSDEEGDHDSDNSSEETQKEKLKLLGEEFEAEIKKKTERIKPRLVGCIWVPNNVINLENVSKSVADTLLKYRCVWDNEEPIITDTPTIIDSSNDMISENKKTALLPDSIIPDLISFVHGKTNFKKISKDFFNELVNNGRNIVDDSSISLAMIKNTIFSIATKSTHAAPWFVTKDNFEKYGIEYPNNVETDVSKLTKSTVKKITSFLTPQHSKKDPILVEKLCTEVDQSMTEPKKLFKQEQKVNIVDGKKRITPISLSPKKKLKLVIEKKPREQSWSPEMNTTCQGKLVPNDTDTVT